MAGQDVIAKCMYVLPCPHQVLDIPRTLEFLETQGVTVAAYGSDAFPAFFSRDSGCKAPARVDTPQQYASRTREPIRALASTPMPLPVRSARMIGVLVHRHTQAAAHMIMLAQGGSVDSSKPGTAAGGWRAAGSAYT
jgi:Indigoidine synthase A like protein